MPGQNWVPLKSAALYRQLASVLGLIDTADQPAMALWPGILPTIDLREFVQDIKYATATLDLTGGTLWSAFKTAWTVPIDKAWLILGITKPAAWSDDAYGVVVHSSAPATYAEGIVLGPASTARTTAKDYLLPFRVPPGWVIGVRNTANVGDGARVLNIMYAEEDSLGL